MERAQGRLLQALTSLPEPVIQRMAGRPIVRDGNRLAPEAHLILTLFRVTRQKPLDKLPIAKARRTLDLQAASLAINQPIGAVRSLTIEGRPARLYTPSSLLGAGKAPTMLYFHGGFHTYGGLKSHAGTLRFLAEQARIQVLALDYRLAPENPFPAGLEDCMAALRWLAANPDAVGADPTRLAVGGDSAGGNLAAATVQSLANEVDLVFQLLVYPVIEFTQTSESRRSLGVGFYLTRTGIEQAAKRYVPDERDRKDPRATVLNAAISPNTPPTLVVTAGFDPLRDEGNAYAEKLREAGVDVQLRQYGDMIHGFFNQVTAGRRAHRYNREIVAAVRDALAN
ncbi:MAG TPA: alpha/beta hydrolase [Aeromicrobium sp.]|nr:alpha/beta hydrolase [Aeromicrobium sp.]